MQDQTVTKGSKASEPETDPSLEGYTFAGWYSDEGLTTEYNFDTEVTADMTLYAKWTANSYNVKFDGNGKDSGDMSDQEFEYDVSQKLTANAYKKTGYTFSGWAETATGNVKYADEKEVKNLTSTSGEEVTLYAKWTISKYTVTFDSNGGSSINAQIVKYNEKASEPETAPGLEGYTFAGWYSDAALTTEYNFDTEVTADITLYAKWEKNVAASNDSGNSSADSNDSTSTGDNSNLMVFLVLMVISIAVTSMELLRRRQK